MRRMGAAHAGHRHQLHLIRHAGPPIAVRNFHLITTFFLKIIMRVKKRLEMGCMTFCTIAIFWIVIGDRLLYSMW